MGRKRLELVKERFGRLLVTEFAYIKKFTYWKCKCDCGNIIIVAGSELRRKNGTKSCGCLRKEIVSIMSTKRLGKNHPRYKHGLTGSKAYGCACIQKRNAMKLNQTPLDANLDIIQFYYIVASTMADVHVDHIQPLSKGGLHHEDNLQILDAHLNLEKASKWPLTEEEQIKYKGFRL